jgi:hypothetical protein
MLVKNGWINTIKEMLIYFAGKKDGVIVRRAYCIHGRDFYSLLKIACHAPVNNVN